MKFRTAILAAAAAAAAPAAAFCEIVRSIPEPPLVKAVREGSSKDVRDLLAAGAPGSFDRCHEGTSLAAYAAARGDVGILEELAKAGVPLGDKECEGSSPLYEAAEQGHADAVRWLLSKGADTRFKVGNGSTPLLAAVQGTLFPIGPKGDALETARLLLEAGSDPDALSSFGSTPLLIAVRRADARLVRALLARKADPLKKGKDGVCPLDVARREKLGYIGALLEGKAPAGPSPLGLKLVAAVGAGDAQAVDRLLAAGAEPGAVDENGTPALAHAAAAGREDIGVALIERGAEVDARSASNATPLIYAASAGALRLTRALLARGADPNAKDVAGNSALAYAARQGRAEAARILLSAGARPDEKDSDGRTLLVEAAAKGDAETVRALLDGKADPEAADAQGRTALMAAAAEGKLHAAQALLEAKAGLAAKDPGGSTALSLAAEHRSPDIARALVAKGAKPDAACLLGAIRSWDVGLTELFLKNGADPSGGAGLEPPVVAAADAYENKAALLKLLLDAGAKPGAADDKGRNPLMAASEWSSQDSLEAVKLLLARGADPKARDAAGAGAWTYAMLHGNNAAAKVLSAAGAAVEPESLAWDGLFLQGEKRFASVVAEQGAWEALWKDLGKDTEAPALDFGACVVGAVSLGRLGGPESVHIRFSEPELSGETLTLGYALERRVIYDADSTSPWAVKVFKRGAAKKFSIPPPPQGRPHLDEYELPVMPDGGLRE